MNENKNSFGVAWTLQPRSLQIKIGFLPPPPPPRDHDSADATLNPCASRKLPGNQPCQADLSIYLFLFFSFHRVVLPHSSGGFTSGQSLAGQTRPMERFNEASFLG